MTALKVLHVKARLDREMGGSVTAITGVARTTSLVGDRATILALTRPDDDLSLALEVGRNHATELRLVDAPRFAPFGFSVRVYRVLRDLVPKNDLVELHEVYSFPVIAASFIAKRRGVPYVIHPHNSLDPYDMRKRGLLKRTLRPLVRRMIRGAAALWFTTEEERDRSDDHGAVVSKVVSPLSVQPCRHVGVGSRFRVENGIGPNDFLLLFMGRIDPKKGLPRTIEAFSKVATKRSYLVIAGSGDQSFTQLIKRQVEDSPASGRIIMSGYLKDQAFADALDASDLFVLHSDNENFGLAPVEAALAGVPSLLSRDVFVARELEQSGVAMVIETSIEALTAALATLMSRDESMIKLANQVRGARVPFSDDDVARRDSAIRRELLSRGRLA